MRLATRELELRVVSAEGVAACKASKTPLPSVVAAKALLGCALAKVSRVSLATGAGAGARRGVDRKCRPARVFKRRASEMRADFG